MNYDKLSRSLRYYYEKGIMQKVAGKFLEFNLKSLTFFYRYLILDSIISYKIFFMQGSVMFINLFVTPMRCFKWLWLKIIAML